MTTVVEPRHMVKSFILCGVELRAWAVWAMFQFIDSLAPAHGLRPPPFRVDPRQLGCTMYLTAVEVDLHYRCGDALEQMGRHGIPFYAIEGCALPQRPSGTPPMEE